MKNTEMNIERIEECSIIKIELEQYRENVWIKASLMLDGKELAKCKIYSCDRVMTEEELWIFFDEIEGVASSHFEIIAENKPYIIDRMQNTRFAYLTSLSVPSELRNKGIGTIFMDKLTDYFIFMRIGELYIVSAIYDDNEEHGRNESFYLRNGFLIVSETEDITDGKMMIKLLF